jgi:hypothetical protein
VTPVCADAGSAAQPKTPQAKTLPTRKGRVDKRAALKNDPAKINESPKSATAKS